MHHVLFALVLGLFIGGAAAQELGTPNGEVILTVTGNIEFSNSENGAEFDLEMLEKLETFSFTTNSAWTNEATVFSGVRVSVLLKAVGARSTVFKATAFDNYWYALSGINFDKYPVLIAYQRDKEYMGTRDLGPLWIMFPFDDYPELLTESNKASSVWQLHAMEIQ